MTISERLKILNQSQKTVFRLRDLKDLWGDKELNAKIAAKRMTEKNLFYRISKGYYALDKDYNLYELANLIVSPSYVSFNSALFYHNVCFQMRKTIDSVALFNYKKKIQKTVFQYFAMKRDLFFNLEGIVFRDKVSLALPERAILDCFYFGFLPSIDAEEKINFNYLKELSIIYPKSVQKKIERFYAKKI